jgi:4-hydroxy-tetrahydrodipicolinate synthase
VPDVLLAATPTPFTADGELDSATARRFFTFLAATVDGLLVAGTTGEFPALDDSERLELIEIGFETAGPDHVIAHIGAPDAYRAARLAASAVALGATKIAAITPFYLAPTPTEIADYYLRIREAAPDAELYSYIFPDRTAVTVPPDQFAQLAETAGLAGAKMSGAAARNVAEYAAVCPGLRIYSGSDLDLAATLRDGGAGVISGRSSAYPEVFGALAAALAAGDAAAAERHQADVATIASLGASIGLLKEALRLRGFAPMAARMPVAEPDDATSARIAEIVKSLTPAALA